MSARLCSHWQLSGCLLRPFQFLEAASSPWPPRGSTIPVSACVFMYILPIWVSIFSFLWGYQVLVTLTITCKRTKHDLPGWVSPHCCDRELPDWGGWNNRNSFCHSYEDQQSKTMMWAGLILCEAVVKTRLQDSLWFQMVANNSWHSWGCRSIPSSLPSSSVGNL